jgi:hypothetical protein
MDVKDVVEAGAKRRIRERRATVSNLLEVSTLLIAR